MKDDLRPLDTQRRQLLRDGLSGWLAWEPPEIRKTVGPFDPKPFAEFDAQRRKAIARCEAKLREYSDEEIAIILGPRTKQPGSPRHTRMDVDTGPTAEASGRKPLDRVDRLKSDWTNHAWREREVIRSAEPAWYAGGFGHPDYQADYDHWTKMRHFSIAETVCLSVGIEPEHFNERDLAHLVEERREKLHPVMRFLAERVSLVARRFDPESCGSRVDPKSLVTWIVHFEVEVPSPFLDRLRAFHKPANPNTPHQQIRASTDKREIDKIAQLITAIAIDDYGYDPDGVRNTAPGEIADLAAEMGLEIHPDTIRKYLRIGATFLPTDWKQKND